MHCQRCVLRPPRACCHVALARCRSIHSPDPRPSSVSAASPAPHARRHLSQYTIHITVFLQRLLASRAGLNSAELLGLQSAGPKAASHWPRPSAVRRLQELQADKKYLQQHSADAGPNGTANPLSAGVLGTQNGNDVGVKDKRFVYLDEAFPINPVAGLHVVRIQRGAFLTPLIVRPRLDVEKLRDLTSSTTMSSLQSSPRRTANA